MSEKNQATENKAPEQGKAARGLPTPAWVVIAVATLVAGVLAGHFLLGGPGTVSLNGRTTLAAGELDSVVATYSEGGATTNVTAREVLEEIQGSSELSANEDGTYDVPSASDILSYVQNKVILADAETRGITATEDEVNDFVTNRMGASSIADVASSYGIDEDAEAIRMVPVSMLGDPDAVVPGLSYESIPGEAPDGRIWRVTDVAEGMAVLEANHPLAGIGLQFGIKVLAVADAPDEEAVGTDDVVVPGFLGIADKIVPEEDDEEPLPEASADEPDDSSMAKLAKPPRILR